MPPALDLRGMLKFSRNKLVSIYTKDENTLLAHGVLEDDIYGLEVDLTIGLSSLEILSVEGRWKRAENSQCSRAIPFLQDAIGFRIDEGFSQKIRKIISRKACRHFADILLECGDAAQMAANLSRGETGKAKKKAQVSVNAGDRVTISGKPRPNTEEKDLPSKGKVQATGGMIIDLHVHTSPASPCSSAPVDEIIQEVKRIGLDGICLTDHNHVWDPDEVEDLRQKHELLILRGNEITTDQGDMVVFGLEKAIKGIVKLKDLREEVSAAKGFIIVAHPFRGFLTFGIGKLGLTVEKAMERPLFKYVDAVEVMNCKVTKKENRFAAEVAEGLNLPATGGSDAHEVSEVGIFATRFSQVITNEKELIEALRDGSYIPIAHREEREKGKYAHGITT